VGGVFVWCVDVCMFYFAVLSVTASVQHCLNNSRYFIRLAASVQQYVLALFIPTVHTILNMTTVSSNAMQCTELQIYKCSHEPTFPIFRQQVHPQY
jgi:hypothetical protein